MMVEAFLEPQAVPFVLSHQCLQIPPSGSCSLDVTFSPRTSMDIGNNKTYVYVIIFYYLIFLNISYCKSLEKITYMCPIAVKPY